MLSYTVSYRMQMGAFTARVIDFPEADALGATLEQARNNVLESLRYAAERRLRRGELLPIPGRTNGDAEAYLVEEVSLWPQGGDRVQVQAG